MNRIVAAGLLSTALSVPAFAQSAQAGDETEIGAGEIIVTAQKRSERLSDVPVSITAATGAQLANAGVSAPSDLVKIVPGFTYRPSDYGTPVFYVRGVGFNDVAIAVAPAVSVYVDQVPLPYLVMTSGASIDLERVEALKGPQGTLFGQNSTGGAINFIAAKPTNQFKAGADFTYGRFNQADIQAFVSGPISENLRGRLVVRHEGRDEWQISQTRPNDRLGARNFTTARLLLDWQATDKLKFEFNANGWIDKSDTMAAQFVRLEKNPAGASTDTTDLIAANYSPAPDNPRIADWGTIRPIGATTAPGVLVGPSQKSSLRRNDNFFQLSLRADLELTDDIDLTSISAYSKFKQRAPVDTDGTAYDDFGMTINGSIKSFSQELRLAGKSGALRWMVGGNYGRDSTVDDQRGDYWGSNNSAVGPFRWESFVNSNRQKIETVSGFGSIDYAFTPTITAQTSVRYTKYRDEFNGCLRDSGNGQLATVFNLLSNALRGFNPPAANAGPGTCVSLNTATLLPVSNVNNVLSEDNVSWRAGLSWKPTSDALVYANVTRGYKAGSFPTVPGLYNDQFAPVGQESVTAYEAGFKLSALNRALQLTGAGFYYQYNNKQLIGYKVYPIFGPLPTLVQIPRSTLKGFELSLDARPVKGLTLTGGLTYVDSKVDTSFVTSDPLGNAVDVEGEQFPITPKWQLTGDVDYRVPVSGALDLAVGANIRYQSASPAAFGNAPGFKIPGYAIVDLRLGLEHPDGKWKAQIWGRNVGNKFYVTSYTKVVDTVARTAGMGATYGISVSFRY